MNSKSVFHALYKIITKLNQPNNAFLVKAKNENSPTKKMKRITPYFYNNIFQSIIMTQELPTTQMNCVYLDTYTQNFIVPLINSLKKDTPLLFEGLIAFSNTMRLFTDESNKRRILTKFIESAESYADTEHQWISDSTENTLKEIARILRDMEPPIEDPPQNYIKLYYDLMNFKNVLDGAARRLHCAELEYIIQEMDKCLPHTANHFEFLLDNRHICVYLNRLERLFERLERSEFDDDKDGPEYQCKAALMRTYLKIHTFDPSDVVQIVIPDETVEFATQWEQFAFDNQAPFSLYPRQMMYRNEPYIKTDLDTWLFAHRVQLKFMNGDEYWRKSPGFQQMDEAVRFAFYNYAGFEYNENWLMPYDPIPDRTWDLAVVPSLPESHMDIPNLTFKQYYDETVADFCNCIEISHALRTSKHLTHIYEQAGKIRTMSEWMMHGIDEVFIENYIYLAPHVEIITECPMIDLSDVPGHVYRRLIDHFARVACQQSDQKKIINSLKLCSNIVV